MTTVAFGMKLHDGNPHGVGGGRLRRWPMLCRTLAALPSICWVCGNGAMADVAAFGWRETGGVDVRDGESEAFDSRLVIGDEAEFAKTGKGELVLPLSNVIGLGRPTLSVLDGTLKLTSGDDSGMDLNDPPAVLRKAAFWVAADSPNLVEDETGVRLWCDVRETDTTTPTLPYAVPAWLDYPTAARTVAKGVPPKKVMKDGRAAVYFGGSGSGQHMNWHKAGSESSVSGVYHFFAVHGVYEAWGAVLGAKGAGGFFIDAAQTPGYGTVEAAGAHFFGIGVRCDMQRSLSVARWFLNGKWIDPWSVPPSKGFQLLSGDCRSERAEFGAFFNQRNVTSQIRQGGDYLSEAIVFTNILTESEKVSIARYLMKKWSLPEADEYGYGHVGQGRCVVDVASRASAEVAASAGKSIELAVTGDGELRKSGEGIAVVCPAYGISPFDGVMALEAGKVSVKGGAVPPTMVGGGDRIVSAPVIDERGSLDATNWQQTARVELTRHGDAAVDCAVKEGAGLVRACGVADGVRRLTLADGTLVLTSRKVAHFATPSDGGAIGAAVPNPSFEQAPEEDIWLERGETDIMRAKITLYDEPYYGWANLLNDYKSVYYIFSYTNGVWTGADAWEAWVNSKLPPTDGIKSLYIKQVGAAYAEVEFPADGDYELSFDATGRFAGSRWYRLTQRNEIGIYLGDSVEDAPNHRVGTLVESGNNPWSRRYFKLENVAKGRRVLMFRSLNVYVDGGTAIDNVSIRYVVHPDRTVRFKVPNGDFEVYNVAPDGGIPSVLTPYAPCSNWTFTASSEWSAGLTNGPVGVASAVTHLFGNDETCLFRDCDKIFGSTMLVFNTYPVRSSSDETQNGFGTASASFRVPGGVYRLRASIASAATNWRDGSNTERSSTARPSIRAVITRENGSEIDLGFVGTKSRVMTKCVWETPFALDEGERITLSLSQPFAGAMALVDDLVFVDGEADDAEILANTGFEQGTIGKASSSWFNYQDKRVFNYGTAEFTDYVGRADEYGYCFYEGKRCLNIGQRAGVFQDVSFPRAGLYRLRFAIRSRPNDQLGHNPMRFWIHRADDAAVTNEIVRVVEHSTNFVEHAYLFSVPSAGSYRFGVTGCGVDERVATENRRTLMDGFSIRPVEDGAYADAPHVPRDLKIVVGDKSRLVLDFAGKIKCSALRIAGRSFSGTVSASDDPEHLSGIGSIEIEPEGLMIFVR